MEELSQNLEQIINCAKKCESQWENEFENIRLKLRAILFGTQNSEPQTVAPAVAASPQQMKKRPKHLPVVIDDEDESEIQPRLSSKDVEESSTVVNETIEDDKKEELPERKEEQEHVFARPMRAAKQKTENCFKEPAINTKLRRPDNTDESIRKVKKESEQRPSQASTKKKNNSNKSQVEVEPQVSAANESVASTKKIDESLVVVCDKNPPVVEIKSEDEDGQTLSKKLKKDGPPAKNPVLKVKKEKLSLHGVEESDKSIEEQLQTTNSTNKTTSTTRNKRHRKKKEFNHRPIKEECVSPKLVVPSPISSRTRSGSTSNPRPTSIYEDAVDNMPQEGVEEKKTDVTPSPSKAAAAAADAAPVANSEVAAGNNVTMVTACDTTFVTNQGNNTFAMPAPQTTVDNPNATVTIAKDAGEKPNGSLGDATFDVRDPPINDSIMTEDDSFDKPLLPGLRKVVRRPPPPVTTKVLKSKSKMNELFNPCLQSPVKKKVEAFENHAQAASQAIPLKTRSKKAKENSEPELPSIRDLKAGAATTPVIGKPHAPALGRFLTPTQQANVTPSATNAKKLPNSASKIMPFPISKQSSASNLKSSSSASSQSLSRENSEEDLKKGYNKLQQLAEERKKKREQKHQQAALMRETKEKERAERLKKIMKEREEKNRKKVLEMEQKKRELEEINRNLKLQEERELKQTAAGKKIDTAEVARQERELLEQMKMPKMKMPPPPKLTNKYNFNMLHSDDSTDEEGKTSYKRPTPPLWSKSTIRADYIISQAYLSSDIIDSFFSVQPMTPDLRAIFPNIDPRYLKRNSSAIWQTPPRYSEMPKY